MKKSSDAPADPKLEKTLAKARRSRTRGEPGRRGDVTAPSATLSLLDAAAVVLRPKGRGCGKAMRLREIVEAILAQRLWHSPGGINPRALFDAISEEIRTQGTKSRFHRVGRGLFSRA
jgi:HB1, ASXL, restriction endonuclease HTH domain